MVRIRQIGFGGVGYAQSMHQSHLNINELWSKLQRYVDTLNPSGAN